MTFTADLTAIATFVLLLLSAISGFLWVGRLSSRVDRLESDVKDLKEDVAKILQLLNQHIGYHQGLADAGTPTISSP